MNLPVDIDLRPGKPRATGRTHVLDKGCGVAALGDTLEVAGAFIDLAKLGWGTGVVTPNVAEKLATYRAHDVELCFGGTLFELAYLQDRVDDYVAWVEGLGVESIEVSDGTVAFAGDDKVRLIERLAKRFTVYSEVGSKDPEAIVSPVRWVRAIEREIAAGAAYVILEGRESGSAGLYRPSGEVRMGLIDEVLESGLLRDRLIFEAPRKDQQVWLLKTHGTDINLGNIALEEALPLETLRLGLRADTLLDLHADPRRD